MANPANLMRMMFIPSNQKTPRWVTVLLMVVGLAGLGYAYGQRERLLAGPDDVIRNLPTAALVLGAMFLMLGVFLFFDTYRSQRAARLLPADWPRQPLLNYEIKRRDLFLPITIIGYWEKAAGKRGKVESPDLSFDPTPFIARQQQLQVAFPPRGGAPRLDLNFLPRPIFVPWQVILFGAEQIEARIKTNGQPIEAHFIGWRIMDSPEDADYTNAAAVFQWEDPGSQQVYVFEGFVLSNEKVPFPDYAVGQRFQGWVDLQRPTDFLIEKNPLS